MESGTYPILRNFDIVEEKCSSSAEYFHGNAEVSHQVTFPSLLKGCRGTKHIPTFTLHHLLQPGSSISWRELTVHPQLNSGKIGN